MLIIIEIIRNNDLKRNGTKKENERDNILPKEYSFEKEKKGEEKEIHFLIKKIINIS